MKRDYVSIIVPVYNNGRYIKKCIESIVNQTYRKLQIILIDDGSTDESGKICDTYAEQDERIEVYHLENRGVSHTRNFGLNKAFGEYIQFVDADDCIKSNMTERLVHKMHKSDIDMVVCNYVKDFRKMKTISNFLEMPGRYTNVEYLQHTLRDPGHHYFGVVWNKLYRLRIIRDNEITFDVRVNLGEDFIFNMQYWFHSKSVLVIKDYLYIYNKDIDVTLSNIRHKELLDCEYELDNRKHIFAAYEEIFRKLGLYARCYQRIQFYWIIFYVRQMHGLQHEYTVWNDEEQKVWKEEIDGCREIRNSLRVVSTRKIWLYKCKYYISYHLKRLIKSIGGIY